MKKITCLFVSAFLFTMMSCSQGANNENQNREAPMENDGFGGVGADPNSGTVVSDDTATSTAPDSVSTGN